MKVNLIISPCDGNCHIDTLTNCYKSCFRTINEIINWAVYSEDEKKKFLKKLKREKNF